MEIIFFYCNFAALWLDCCNEFETIKAMSMSEKEFNLYVEALDKGLLEAERNMLHEKAARGETCVYQDDNGRIYHVAAKDVIAANPRFQ